MPHLMYHRPIRWQESEASSSSGADKALVSDRASQTQKESNQEVQEVSNNFM